MRYNDSECIRLCITCAIALAYVGMTLYFVSLLPDVLHVGAAITR